MAVVGYQELRSAMRTLGITDVQVEYDFVKKKYKRLLTKWHPDAAPDGEEAFYTTKTAEINAAFDVIEKAFKQGLMGPDVKGAGSTSGAGNKRSSQSGAGNRASSGNSGKTDSSDRNSRGNGRRDTGNRTDHRSGSGTGTGNDSSSRNRSSDGSNTGNRSTGGAGSNSNSRNRSSDGSNTGNRSTGGTGSNSSSRNRSSDGSNTGNRSTGGAGSNSNSRNNAGTGNKSTGGVKYSRSTGWTNINTGDSTYSSRTGTGNTKSGNSSTAENTKNRKDSQDTSRKKSRAGSSRAQKFSEFKQWQKKYGRRDSDSRKSDESKSGSSGWPFSRMNDSSSSGKENGRIWDNISLETIEGEIAYFIEVFLRRSLIESLIYYSVFTVFLFLVVYVTIDTGRMTYALRTPLAYLEWFILFYTFKFGINMMKDTGKVALPMLIAIVVNYIVSKAAVYIFTVTTRLPAFMFLLVFVSFCAFIEYESNFKLIFPDTGLFAKEKPPVYVRVVSCILSIQYIIVFGLGYVLMLMSVFKR